MRETWVRSLVQRPHVTWGSEAREPQMVSLHRAHDPQQETQQRGARAHGESAAPLTTPGGSPQPEHTAGPETGAAARTNTAGESLEGARSANRRPRGRKRTRMRHLEQASVAFKSERSPTQASFRKVICHYKTGT